MSPCTATADDDEVNDGDDEVDDNYDVDDDAIYVATVVFPPAIISVCVDHDSAVTSAAAVVVIAVVASVIAAVVINVETAADFGLQTAVKQTIKFIQVGTGS